MTDGHIGYIGYSVGVSTGH